MNQFVFGGSYWNNVIDTSQYTPVSVSFASVGYGTNGNVPQETYQKKFQFKDSVNWNKGSHSLKFGVDWVFEPLLGYYQGSTSVPYIGFFDDPMTILTNKTLYPQGFSTPGIVRSITETNEVKNARFDFPNNINFFGWYVQDDWRVSRKLTLNLGVRYDVDLGMVGAGGIMANDRTYLAIEQINDPLTNGFKKKLPGDAKKNYAPRVGFAFDPTGKGKTVIRGGYGMYYDQLFYNINLFAIEQSEPIIFGTVVSLNNTAIGQGHMPNWIVNQTPLPPIPRTPLTQFPASGGATGLIVDPNYTSPLAQEFNVGFSREFAKDFVMETDYTHVLNIHESRIIRLNWKVNGVRRLVPAFEAAGIDPSTWGTLDTASVNRSRYDGLSVTVRKRLSHRVTLQGSYTLARALGYGGLSGTFGGSALVQNNTWPLTNWCRRPGRTASLCRVRCHRSALGIPGLRPSCSWLQPAVQLTAGGDTNGDGVTNDLCVPGTTGMHGFVCPQNVSRFGQRGGYDLSGNWQSGDFFLANLRVSKFISLSRVKEGMNLSFSFEAFNLTNRTNFGRNFSGNIRSTTPFLTTLGPATGGYGITAATPFQAQLGLRFGF